MKFWLKAKGAVSVFLVIILVPMLTVTALFVDAGKVRLAKGVAESAGDLAVNTALTNYDTKLKDMYGLFATAQDTEDLYAKLENYYRSCITSSGVTEEDAESYVDQIMAQLGMVAEDDSTADILGMELIEFSVSKRSDATLANATVLEKQIVDFMKYRAPINSGLEFLSSLKSFTTIAKQTELVEKRKAYYEEQQTIMENAQEAWKYISWYNRSGFVQSDQYFSDMVKDFGTYQASYLEIVRKTIKDLYDTQNYTEFNPYLYTIVEEDIGKEKNVPVFYTNKKGTSKLKDYTEYTDFSEKKLATASDVKKALEKYYSAYLALKEAEKNLLQYDDGTYALQYLVQMQRGKLYKNWVSTMVDLYNAYSYMRHTVSWCGKTITGMSVMTVSGDIKRDGNQRMYGEFYNDFTKNFDLIAAAFNKNLPDYNSTLQTYSNQVIKSGATNLSETSRKIQNLYGEACQYRKTVSEAIGNLGKAVEFLGYVESGLEELEEKKEEWSDLAGSKDLANTSMARQDLAELDSLDTYLNEEDVGKLKQRLENIKSNLEQVLKQIDSYTLFGTKITEIDSYNSLVHILENKIGKQKLKTVPTNEKALDKQIENWSSGKFVGAKIDISWENRQGTQARLAGSGTDKLNFYTWLYTHFSQSVFEENANPTTEQKEDEENGKELYEKLKGDAAKQAEDTTKTETKTRIDTKEELCNLGDSRPSKGGGNNKETPANETISTGENAAKDTSGNLNSMLGDLSSAIKDMGSDLRDKLYVSEYILGMFSYNTIESEFKAEHPEEEIVLKTLTKEPITKDNTYAYGREVEYIIYGGTNAANLAKAYGSIYGIRLGFNLIYAFSDASIRDTAFAIAAPISAATLGVIPAPLIQAAIIIGIACCESALDLVDLKDGESVPLFKTKETFRCSLTGLATEVKDKIKEEVKDGVSAAVDLGSKGLNKLLDMTDEQLTEYLEKGEDDLISTVSESYDELITRHANTAIQKLTTLCSQVIDESLTNPGADMAGMVKGKLDEWIVAEKAAVGESDLGYIIKKEAVEIIKDQFVDEVLNALIASGDYAKSSVEEAANELSGALEKVRNEITKTISTSCDEVKKYKEEMKNKLSEAAAKGAGELKKALNEQIDGVFDGVSESGTPLGSDATGIASLLKFAYSDYLQLFVMIGLYTNEEGVLLRTADVIQANMSKRTGEKDYLLSNAAAYVQVNTTVQVPPTLMALPLFASTTRNLEHNQNWYAFECEIVGGY